MKLKLYPLTLLFAFCFAATSQAQLFIDNSYTAEEMVMDFFDNSCVTPSNITYTGSLDAFAFYDAGNTDLGAQAGMLLSTGDVFSAIGPNNQGGTTGSMGSNGDTDLDNLSGGFQTFDASVLEMDILVTESQVSFSYVFASEEYPEYVATGFNDIFAFFISGPGINGLENIAMVPNSQDPVSINTINGMTNVDYYYDNTNGQDIQFDGFTTALTASVDVTPNETYHIKIVIADVSDSAFDSGIFLGLNSLCGEDFLTPPALANVMVDDMTVTFQNDSKYATSYSWDFGDNTTSTDKNPAPHTYAAEGFYDVQLITYNYCCSDTMIYEVTIGNPTGIENLAVKPYQFSPNPVRDFAQLQFDNGAAFDLSIFNAAGIRIDQYTGNGSTELLLEDYESGVYFMEVRVGELVYWDKFLKM